MTEVTIETEFPSSRVAQIVYDVLRVDKEPKRSQVTKEFTLDENKLKV